MKGLHTNLDLLHNGINSPFECVSEHFMDARYYRVKTVPIKW